MKTLEKKEEIVERVEKILNCQSPINIDGNIDDLENYISVYRDGNFSDDKVEWLFNPSTKVIIRHWWSLWQGSEDSYCQKSLKDYMEIMPTDQTHFERWVDGLKKIVVEN